MICINAILELGSLNCFLSSYFFYSFSTPQLFSYVIESNNIIVIYDSECNPFILSVHSVCFLTVHTWNMNRSGRGQGSSGIMVHRSGGFGIDLCLLAGDWFTGSEKTGDFLPRNKIYDPFEIDIKRISG